MPEQLEVEVKFVLCDPEAMRHALLVKGAQSKGRCFENNIRLDDVHHTLAAHDIVLRVRQFGEQDSLPALLTVKTPAGVQEESLRVRNEIELEVSDGQAMLSVLSILGYSPILRYERWRETFSWGSAEVVIDELPFGWFMEIEGEAKEIQNIAQMLGLNMADGLTLSYVRIFENVRHVLGLSMPDLTFEAFKEIVVSPEAYRDQ